MTNPRREPWRRTVFTGVLLVVFALSAFVWAMAATGSLNSRNTNVYVTVWDGNVGVNIHGLDGRYSSIITSLHVRVHPALRRGYRMPGFWVLRESPESIRVQIPLFVPLTLAAGWTAWGWFFYTRRRSDGTCRACGYDMSDLTTPTCPECGRTA